MSAPPALTDVDPFELPDWLGVEEVTWVADSGLRGSHHVAGRLTGADRPDVDCDLLAVDEAFPAPVAGDAVRARAHQAWRHGQVLLVAREERLTLAVPGASFTADLLLDALSRLARAVGGTPERYAALLRLGRDSRDR